MPDYSGLVKVMKQAGSEAVGANGPVCVCFGNVTSASPLKILVDQKMTLGSAQLVLTRNVTNHEETVIIDGVKKTMTINNALKSGEEVVLLRQQGGQKYIIIDKVG